MKSLYYQASTTRNSAPAARQDSTICYTITVIQSHQATSQIEISKRFNNPLSPAKCHFLNRDTRGLKRVFLYTPLQTRIGRSESKLLLLNLYCTVKLNNKRSSLQCKQVETIDSYKLG